MNLLRTLQKSKYNRTYRIGSGQSDLIINDIAPIRTDKAYI